MAGDAERVQVRCFSEGIISRAATPLEFEDRQIERTCERHIPTTALLPAALAAPSLRPGGNPAKLRIGTRQAKGMQCRAGQSAALTSDALFV
ncbi:hypothetical protein ACQPTN_32995 [Bradyrhizobium sp. 13971]|uniref:hypothetical protein n=1 Tax=Bradyrhizobium elkanii TaxID=29448 RepID=UPI00114D2344|nr:hypothetical protein [Bradyrhizobium elkanii]